VVLRGSINFINIYKDRIMKGRNKDKNICICPYCNAEIELSERPFCEHCQLDIEINYCKECGKPVPPEAKVCPACGQS